ncbi:hypothetical protein B0H13DRAFT_2027092 [Mycena leptocephala]|nr:hypothetical protein B0H13DRAFT_2027092 [Mycena leptocephala]
MVTFHLRLDPHPQVLNAKPFAISYAPLHDIAVNPVVPIPLLRWISVEVKIMGFWYACSLSFPAHLTPAHTLHTPIPPFTLPGRVTEHAYPFLASDPPHPCLLRTRNMAPSLASPSASALSKQIPPLPSETKQSWVHAPGLCVPLASTPVLCAPPAVLHPPLVPSPSWTAPARTVPHH